MAFSLDDPEIKDLTNYHTTKFYTGPQLKQTADNIFKSI